MSRTFDTVDDHADFACELLAADFATPYAFAAATPVTVAAFRANAPTRRPDDFAAPTAAPATCCAACCATSAAFLGMEGPRCAFLIATRRATIMLPTAVSAVIHPHAIKAVDGEIDCEPDNPEVTMPDVTDAASVAMNPVRSVAVGRGSGSGFGRESTTSNDLD